MDKPRPSTHAHRFAFKREVPLKPSMAVTVTKDGDLIAYLHQYICRERWEETHPGYVYSLPKS